MYGGLNSTIISILDKYPRLSALIAATRELFSFFAFHYHVMRGKPYFGTHLASRQVKVERAPYMRALVRRVVAERGSLCMAEIGSWAGESAVLWAETAKQALHVDSAGANAAGTVSIICIDPWVFYPSLGTNPWMLAMKKAVRSGTIFPLFLHNVKFSGNLDTIIPIRAESQNVVHLFRDDLFDLIYIDGDHAYSSVMHDIRRCAGLVKEGGYLCGDDLQLQASIVDEDYAKAHRDKDLILDPKWRRHFHPGVTLAVGEFFGEVSSYAGFWVMQRNGKTWRKVQL